MGGLEAAMCSQRRGASAPHRAAASLLLVLVLLLSFADAWRPASGAPQHRRRDLAAAAARVGPWGGLGWERVWVYTLVAADYDGAALLPHFINYYHQLGVGYRRFLVMVHHTPGKYSRAGLDAVKAICMSYKVECRIWKGQFSSEAHLQRMLHVLNDFVLDPHDWIVMADNDEFQDWGGRPISEVLSGLPPEVSFIKGHLLDRVAEGGRVMPITPPDAGGPGASLFEQYPLTCHVVKNLYKGWDYKVAAFRNFLRSGRANHFIVSPDKARAYFGPCAPGAKCPRGRNINLEEDFFPLTPFAKYPERYRYKHSPAESERPPGSPPLWSARASKGSVVIHHFKWHRGVLLNMKDRAEYYSGDCVLGRNEATCTPVLFHWRESAKTYNALRDSMQLDLSGLNCSRPAAGKGVAVDTSNNGLPFGEDKLHVHSESEMHLLWHKSSSRVP